MTMLGREKLRSRLRDIVAEQYTAEEIVDEGRLLVRLGLLPACTSYEEVIYGLLEEQILGLYDPTAGELVLLEGTWDTMVEGVLVHELTHAVQDMNFDLDAISERRPGHGDESAALEAVAEGDAMLMEQVLGGVLLPDTITPEQMELMMQLAPVEGPAMAKTPDFIRSVLLFPYLYGFVLVRAAYEQGGYAAVNALFTGPPVSTEQVMHPERIGKDQPERVALELPAVLAPLYRVAVDDVMGEFALRSWLEQWILEPDAERAAGGWGGDHALLLWPSDAHVGEEHVGHGVLVLATSWDPGPAAEPEREAAEFESALELYLANRYPGTERRDLPARTVVAIPGDQIALLERRSRRVLLVEGLPAQSDEALDALASGLWASILAE
jgi:hypothetical protein